MPDELNELKAPTPPSEEPKDDLSGLKNKNFELIGEQKRLKQSLAEREALLQKVTDVLGTVDPESLAALKASQEREKEAAARMESEISKAAAEVERKYGEQISQLAKQLNDKEQFILGKAKEEALSQVFQESGGLEFDFFKACLATRFSVEYAEEANGNGVPTYRVESIKDKSGKTILIDGEIAKPEQVLDKMRRGEFGQPLSALFVQNRSTGAGLPNGVANGKGVVTYKRSQQAVILQQPGMAARMIAGEVVFED